MGGSEVEIFADLVSQATEKNTIVLAIMMGLIIIVQRVLDNVSKFKIQNREIKRDETLNQISSTLEILSTSNKKMIDTCSQLMQSNEQLLLFIGEIRNTNISTTREQVKKVIELSIKKVERDIFSYVRAYINNFIESNNVEKDIRQYCTIQFNKLESNLSLFEFNNKKLNNDIEDNVFSNLAEILIIELTKDIDNKIILDNVESKLRSYFDNYILIVTKDIL